jgi:hypothetical protein
MENDAVIKLLRNGVRALLKMSTAVLISVLSAAMPSPEWAWVSMLDFMKALKREILTSRLPYPILTMYRYVPAPSNMEIPTSIYTISKMASSTPEKLAFIIAAVTAPKKMLLMNAKA